MNGGSGQKDPLASAKNLNEIILFLGIMVRLGLDGWEYFSQKH